MVGVADEAEVALREGVGSGLEPAPGELALLLLTSPRGVTLGTALTRRPELVQRIRAVPGLGEVRLSPMAGTVGPGGEHWLGFLAAARLEGSLSRPLDLLCSSVRGFLEERLGPRVAGLAQGRVEGAWCPGFSDLGLGGRKLCGLGLRLVQGLGLVRGVVAVSPPDGAEMEALDACHRVFGAGLRRDRMISLSEIVGREDLGREEAIRWLGGEARPTAKMSR